MSTNDFISRSDSFDNCDITGLLEDLKFRKSITINSNSKKSNRSSRTSVMTASGPSKPKHSPFERRSFSKQVKTRLRSSFQRSSTSSCKIFIEEYVDATSYGGNLKVNNRHSMTSFEPKVFDPDGHVVLPLFEEDNISQQSFLLEPSFKMRQDAKKEERSEDKAVMLTWMMPNAEIV